LLLLHFVNFTGAERRHFSHKMAGSAAFANGLEQEQE
jgi:hypothetical protein